MEILNDLIQDADFYRAADYYIDNRYKKSFEGNLSTELKNTILNGLIKLVEDDEHKESFELIGSLLFELNNFSQAIKYFKKAEQIGELKPIRYEEYGESLYEQKEYQLAIEKFNASIDKRKNPPVSLYYKAKCYVALEDHENANATFQHLLNAHPTTAWFIYEYGDYLEKQGDFEKAVEILLLVNHLDGEGKYFVNAAKNKLEAIRTRIQSDTINKFTILIDKILDSLKYLGDEVIHYTSITAAKAMIFDNSKFRLSEASHLNDPSEGEVFNNYIFNDIAANTISQTINADIITHFPKPYIGSFVAKGKENSLTSWRMYGKENDVEAAGCYISLNRKSFTDITNTRISPKSTLLNEAKNFEFNPDVEFYRVAYISKSGSFFIPEAEAIEPILNDLCVQLKACVKSNEIPSMYLQNQLSRIAYLFKGAEFSEEHEIRIIVTNQLIDPVIEFSSNKPKVFCEISTIQEALLSICFGPKTPHKEEFMSAFYHKLSSQGKAVNVSASMLRYK